MQLRAITLASVFVLHGAPALAFDNQAVNPAPKALTSFYVGDQRFEMLAVGRLTRADTAFRRAHLDECQTMDKVWPGYPQPAFISFDIRFKF